MPDNRNRNFLMEHKYCIACGRELVLHNNRDIGRKQFCSRKCLAVTCVAGKKHSIESLERMHHPHKQYAITEKVRAAQRAKGLSLRGDKSHFYRNGSTPETRLRTNRADWRALTIEIIKRDDYICQKCGATDCKLTVHHIIPWVLTHSDSPINLTSLCQSCHAKEELEWTPILVKLGMRKEFTNVSSRF